MSKKKTNKQNKNQNNLIQNYTHICLFKSIIFQKEYLTFIQF